MAHNNSNENRSKRREGGAEPISLDQTLKPERGQGKRSFAGLTDHERNWPPVHKRKMFVFSFKVPLLLYTSQGR